MEGGVGVGLREEVRGGGRMASGDRCSDMWWVSGDRCGELEGTCSREGILGSARSADGLTETVEDSDVMRWRTSFVRWGWGCSKRRCPDEDDTVLEWVVGGRSGEEGRGDLEEGLRSGICRNVDDFRIGKG